MDLNFLLIIAQVKFKVGNFIPVSSVPSENAPSSTNLLIKYYDCEINVTKTTFYTGEAYVITELLRY